MARERREVVRVSCSWRWVSRVDSVDWSLGFEEGVGVVVGREEEVAVVAVGGGCWVAEEEGW